MAENPNPNPSQQPRQQQQAAEQQRQAAEEQRAAQQQRNVEAQHQAVEREGQTTLQGRPTFNPAGAQGVPEQGSSSIKPPAPNPAGSVVHAPLSGPALALAQSEAARAEGGSAEEREAQRSVKEGESTEAPSGDRVWVESALPEARVALYERDPSHPSGEVFVGPNEAVEVARTGAVEARLRAGILREASDETRRATDERRAKAEEAAQREREQQSGRR